MEINYCKLPHKVLVTGATGLVGSHLVSSLLSYGRGEGGYRVSVLARVESVTTGLEFVLEQDGYALSDVEILRADTDDYPSLRDIVTGGEFDVIFHCAAKVALVSAGEYAEQDLVRQNVELTHYVVESAMECKKRPLMVHVSSIAALGQSSKPDSPAIESTVVEPMSQISAYGRSKFLAEMEVWRAMSLGLQGVIVCPSVVLGVMPGGGGLMPLLRMLGRHGLSFCTGGVNGFVDVRDLARMMVILSRQSDTWGQRYIVSSGNYSFRQLIEGLNRAFGYENKTVFLINKAILSPVLSVLNVFLSNFSSSMQRMLSTKNYYSSDKISLILSKKTEYTPLAATLDYIALIYNKINKQKSEKK